MTDAQRLLVALREAGPKGLHSHDIRRQALTANPSQRAADLEAKGHSIERIRENRGKRPGTRYKLVGVGSANREGDHAVVAAPLDRPGVLSNCISTPDGARSSCAADSGEPARLFALPSESALTRRPEAA